MWKCKRCSGRRAKDTSSHTVTSEDSFRTVSDKTDAEMKCEKNEALHAKRSEQKYFNEGVGNLFLLGAIAALFVIVFIIDCLIAFFRGVR